MYARYNINQYTITYKEGSKNIWTPAKANYNTNLKTGPKKTGHTFQGWYTATSGGTKVTKVPAKNLTVYARYKINQYTITYYDGSKLIKTAKADYNSALIAGPEKSGYDFTGWYTATTGGNVVTKVPTKNLTVYARYKPKTDYVAAALNERGYQNHNGATGGVINTYSRWTKYGQWYADMTLNPKYADNNWCDMFVSWCARKPHAGYEWSLEVPMTALVSAKRDIYVEEGRWKNANGYTPKRGDLIFFNGHIGIVTGSSGGKVYTIEGNSHAYIGGVEIIGIVAIQERGLTNAQIIGYGIGN